MDLVFRTMSRIRIPIEATDAEKSYLILIKMCVFFERYEKILGSAVKDSLLKRIIV